MFLEKEHTKNDIGGGGGGAHSVCDHVELKVGRVGI